MKDVNYFHILNLDILSLKYEIQTGFKEQQKCKTGSPQQN